MISAPVKNPVSCMASIAAVALKTKVKLLIARKIMPAKMKIACTPSRVTAPQVGQITPPTNMIKTPITSLISRFLFCTSAILPSFS